MGDALKTHIGYATVIPGQIVEGVEAIEMVDRQFGDFRGIVHHLEVYCPPFVSPVRCASAPGSGLNSCKSSKSETL
ncbi:MAG: hypothetical protein AAFR26_19385 [Cyanobacteria bacterium J06626_4]